MNLTDCKRYKRYWYFYSDEAITVREKKYVVGNFIWLYSKTLIITEWEKNGIKQVGELSIPKDWIKSVCSLDDIVDNTILPEDIVLKIGQY